MKLKKKTVMLLSFAMGTLLFTTNALAEVASKSGYDQMKDALKNTAESCSSKLSNYTMDTSFVMKDNNEIVSSFNQVSKCDSIKGAREDKSTSIDYQNIKKENYTYNDKNSNINFNSSQNIYYVNEYDQPNGLTTFRNPFKEKSANDLEKIADAVIGNLKDYVLVSVKPDGSKELSGSLSESQIPALVNAVTSFEFKNSFGGYYAARLRVNTNTAPKIASDIFVKNVKGNIVVNKNGLIESILGTGTLSGKDDKGTEHTMTFEVLGKLHDVNTTVISKPDLTGKKVQKNTKSEIANKPNLKSYTGQYKGDIVINKDGKLEKIGEKIIDIERSDDKVIAGRYHEEFKKGYEEYAADRKDFKFQASFDKDPYNASYNYTNSAGKSAQGNIGLTPYGTKLYFYFSEPPKGNTLNDVDLSKVFD
jgi:hypothetical protein